MPRELSPFELDRELSQVAPRAKAAWRALATGREVSLTIPEVLRDAETLDRVATDTRDPIAPALLRALYWLELMQRALPRAGERMRRYRLERHALDRPLSGHFTWRELLGHALRDAARRPALLELMWQRGDALRDAGSKLFEVRAQLPSFGGRSRAQLELPSPNVAAQALAFLQASSGAQQSLEARDLATLIGVALAPQASDGWPRQLAPRTLAELLGSPDWLSGLRPEVGELPRALSAASFARGLLRLGAGWYEALAPSDKPFCFARDPFGLGRASSGALFAALLTSPAFLRRQLGLGRERAAAYARALSQSALLYTRGLCLRVLTDEPALNGPRALTEAFSEYGAQCYGFELPPGLAGLWLRPRLGDAQRFCGALLAATRAEQLESEHDEDWYRNPRAIEQLRAEARVLPETTCSEESLLAGGRVLLSALSSRL